VHLFYETAEIAALATSDVIRLVVQVPLKTERRIYTVYDPISSHILESALRKFLQMENGGGGGIGDSIRQKVLYASPPGYKRNCKGGAVTGTGVVPIIDRAYETCLGGIFFWMSQGYQLRSREILVGEVSPVFRRLPFKNEK
jgi:hypothetical protein